MGHNAGQAAKGRHIWEELGGMNVIEQHCIESQRANKNYKNVRFFCYCFFRIKSTHTTQIKNSIIIISSKRLLESTNF